MATINSEMSPSEHPDGATAETENLNSNYEFREVIWETCIRPMRSPILGQIRPEGIGPSRMKKDS
jgi:hypothetical protein